MLDGEPWTEFCLQQADRILAVTAGGSVPDGLGQRPELRGCDLVVHDVALRSGALESWADALDPIESHVVRASHLDQDLARAARRLSGRSVGVVLSGGGARAFSHIGVLEELTAAGVTIDRVAGVSMGALSARCSRWVSTPTRSTPAASTSGSSGVRSATTRSPATR